MSFHYQDGTLFCESFPLTQLASGQPTPLYVYSQTGLDGQIGRFLAAGADQPGAVEIAYAVKANGNVHLLRQIGTGGLGADVTSGGELFLAQRAGFPSSRITYSGVGKRDQEINAGLAAEIGAFHVESAQELDRISALAAAGEWRVGIGVRVNPDISGGAHPHIRTGQAGHKFGVPPDEARALLRRAAENPWLKARALSVHIGSQVTDVGAFRAAADLMASLALSLADDGLRLDYVDMGGGLAVDYGGATAPNPRSYLEAVAGPINGAGFRCLVEPGRSLVAACGVLLTRVLSTKMVAGKQFVITDAGMSDLIRPALYRAQHPIWPVTPRSGPDVAVDVVGPICESGDFLAQDCPLPPVAAGDLLAVMQAGAYGYAMSSNYNGRCRPAELLVHGDRARVIRPAESYIDLL